MTEKVKEVLIKKEKRRMTREERKMEDENGKLQR